MTDQIGVCPLCQGAVIVDYQAVHAVPHCIECGHMPDYAVNATPKAPELLTTSKLRA